ncbi:MAG: hypothetical protein MR966_01270 [Lachnospiraceae bacterium]|nr:hypothetical protein [Lachnospiraceae bacterium]
MNRDKVNIITKICFGLFGFLLAVSAVIVTYNNPESWRNNVLVVILAALMIFVSRDIQLKEEDSEYREYLVERLQNEECNDKRSVKVELIDQNRKDIIALMLKNNDEITEYFRISKSHAKSSYWFSIISCVIGLIILCISVYMIFVKENLQVAVISIISGSITELISATVFWVHNKSALQLNHYYDALHENEKFLSAVNIVDKLSDDRKDEMYIEIIRKQINIGIKQTDKNNPSKADEE